VTDVRLSAPGTKAGRLQRACLRVLRQHAADGALPTSSRFVYYELKQAGVDTGTHPTRRADQDVVDAVKRLRDAGEIPWDWIVDETRSVQAAYTTPSVRRWVVDVLDQARVDPWDGEAPMVLTESRGVAGALRASARAYGVPIASTNGQVGGFLHTDIAPMLRRGQAVAYFGDHNVAGSHIEANTRRVLEREAGPLAWQRIAVTPRQAEAADPPLPPKPGTDRRYRDGRPHVSYECEALGQATLPGLLAGWLDELLPEPLADVQERERVQRERLAEVLDAIDEDG